MHCHDLRHTHETWLIKDRVPRILRLVRFGHKRRDVDDIYSLITKRMIEETLDALQERREQDGGWTWCENPVVGQKRRDLFGLGIVVSRPCSPFAPHNQERPADEDHRQAV
jgi:hypothetical protein